MIFIYLFFLILFLLRTKFLKKNFNIDYLSKRTTTIINGIFVITIFFSHFKTYLMNTNVYDECLIEFLNIIGQLMVTSFLFYSGYGIYESIKNKKNYMQSFFQKRFLPTFVNFVLAVLIFLVIDLIIGNTYSIDKVLLSLIGYESIGNSNWYMLAIFILYFLTIFCFNRYFNIKNIYRIILLFFLTCIYIYLITRFKDAYYADTIICYPVGMLYSYYKKRIENFIEKKYYLHLILMIFIFGGCFYLNKKIPNIYISNVYAASFIILITIISMKFEFNSKIIYFFGLHTFWIYILQRIPMIIFKNKFNNYFYLILCFIITIVISYIMKKLTDNLWKKLLMSK